jgi:hypothetical protein
MGHWLPDAVNDYALTIVLLLCKPLLGAAIYGELLLSAFYSVVLVLVQEFRPMVPLAALAVAMLGLAHLSLVTSSVLLSWASLLAIR